MNNDIQIDGNAVSEFIQIHALRKTGSRDGGWTIEYIDDRTGVAWELTYPHSEWHGGGPPRLQRTSQKASNEEPPHTPAENE